jgi:tRNA threonylcarbamoyladenosine modification (KEOPS) complex  Pcc1 subunit
MKHKMLTINCQNNLCEDLAMAITHYAYAAYPPGGSECAQASREALETLAQTIKSQNSEHVERTSIQIKARQRSTLKAAINWYFTEVEINKDKQTQLLALLT